MSKIKKALKKIGKAALVAKWFTNLWILVVASIYGIKGTQIFKNGGNKNGK